MIVFRLSFSTVCQVMVSIYVIVPAFVASSYCISGCQCVLSPFVPPSLCISGCICVNITFRSSILCISGCLCVIITFRSSITEHLSLAMCYYHFSFLHHCAYLVVYVLLSLFVPPSLCISGCLCVIITFRSFTTAHL